MLTLLKQINCSYDQAGKLWILLVQQIDGAIKLFNDLMYRDDLKLAELQIVREELKGHLVSHLHK